uniref:C2H2-type domain-containing protein n=1 Tax=Graphocephala atropunctata TaxID=36148 RepID=A0A1B6LUV4_9HEMI
MSDKGVSDYLEENSGEIKTRGSSNVVFIDNCDSVLNSSYMAMGHASGELVSGDGSASVCGKQIEETIIDESSVNFKDFQCIEEWLKVRTDLIASVDFEAAQNYDLLNFNSDRIVTNGNESSGTILPQITNFPIVKIGECNLSVENWEDFVLEPESVKNLGLVDFSNISTVVPDKPIRSNSLSELDKLSSIDGFLNAPNITISSSPTKLKSSEILNNERQTENTSTNVCMSVPTQTLFKKFPSVKISKKCLMKGKILGKINISILSGQSYLPLLDSQIQTIEPTDLNVNPVSKNLEKSLQLKDKRQPASLVKKCLDVNGTPTMGVLPIKSVKNSLLKVNQTRSLLKINNNKSNASALQTKTLVKKPSKSMTVLHKRPKKKETVPVALVAISTDKSVNTTEVVIKTDEGENVYLGKTSDIMKATGSVNEQTTVVPENSDSGLIKTNENQVVNDILMKLFGVKGEDLEGTPQCPVDGCQFKSQKGNTLIVHILQHYGIRPFKCDFPNCTWAFYTSFRLKRHQEIHYKRKEYKCPVEGCNRTFSTIYNVNLHLKLHCRPNTITCSIDGCNKAFQTRKSYDKHLMEHGPEHAPYTCSKAGCGRKCFTVNSLNSHSRTHQHAEEELTCIYCGKNFKAPCRLKAHLNIHLGVRPYKCAFEGCTWAFSTSSKLRRHQKKHTQTRQHLCKICGKAFLRSDHLKDHILKHLVKKSFVCPIADCWTVFSNKSTMYTHLKRHRNEEATAEIQSYPCPMDNCNLAFNTKQNLRTHLRISHSNLSSDKSQDAIQLLADDHLMSMETLQPSSSNSGPGILSFNSMSQEGLLVGMSDLVQCIPAMEQGEYSETSASNNIITHVVFTDDTTLEPTLADIEETVGSGHAGVTYQTMEGQSQETKPSDSVPSSLHMASDVVLSAGLLASHDNLERSLLLQDELSSGDLYSLGQDESGLGELQVLLLDATARLQPSELEQSTINLRDLE